MLLCACTILMEYNNDAEKVISGITMSHDDDEDIETGRLEIIILRKFPIILFLNSQFICYYSR